MHPHMATSVANVIVSASVTGHLLANLSDAIKQVVKQNICTCW